MSARSDSTRLCPDCAAPLAEGVCPACALGGLLRSGGNVLTEVEEHASAPESEVEFGRYVLKRRVASGGMGVVYEAVDQKLKRTVALKMIRGATFADEAELARFTIEAEAAAALDHPNIVPIYEVGRKEGQPFFTMKLIDGQSLAERLKDGSAKLSARETAQLLAKIARAVHHAHQRGVLHRDLKPGNILLDAQGEPWLTDFGLAKLTAAEANLTLTTDRLGTPNYMAPEVASGRARDSSTASDVWALGVLLWEMLTGSLPFHGNGPVETMRRIVEDDPQLATGTKVSGDLLTIARRCLEKQPGKRPGSAAEVAEELERWLRGEPIKTRRATALEHVVKWMRRNPAIAALYMVMTTAGVISFLLWQKAEKAVVGLTATNEQLEYSLRVSTARKLAGDARLQTGEDPARALLLAAASVEMTENTPAGVLPESASALSAVLQEVGGRDVSVNGMRERRDVGYLSIEWEPKSASFISPDSRWLVSISYESYLENGATAALFDLTDGSSPDPVRRWLLLPKALERKTVPHFTWLADSRHFFSLSATGEATLWDLVVDGNTAGEPERIALGNVDPPNGKITGRFLATPTPEGKVEAFVIWSETDDSASGGFLTRVTCGASGLTRGASLSLVENPLLANYYISPSGNWLLGIAKDKMDVIFTDLRLPEPIWPTFASSAAPVDIHFLAKDGWIALGTEDNRHRVVGLPEKVGNFPLSVQEGPTLPTGLPMAIDFSPDGRWMAIAGDGGHSELSGKVQLLPLDGGSTVTLSLPRGSCYAVKFSHDATWVAAGGQHGAVSLWRVSELRRGGASVDFQGLPSEVFDIQFSPNGKHLVATGPANLSRCWPLENMNPGSQPAVFAAGTQSVRDLAVSVNGNWLAAGCQSSGKAGTENDGVVVVGSADGGISRTLVSHADFASGVAFSPDGKWLATTGQDGLAKLWDAAEVEAFIESGPAPKAKFVLPMEDTRLAHPRRLAFHPRGTLYCVCGDGILFSWDVNSSDPAATRESQVVSTVRYLLPDVAVSPDGKWLAVARHGWDRPEAGSDQFGNQVLLFDVGQPGPPVPVAALEGCFIEYGNLAFSPDSRWLLAGGVSVPSQIWDLSAADIAKSVILSPVTAQAMGGVDFSPDGKWVALAGMDGLLHLWDWRGSGQIRTIHCRNGLLTACFLEDGRVAVAGALPKVSVFDTNMDRLKVMARRVAGRELNPGEISRFRVSAQP